ncbi:MAG: hypothetical protein HYX72_03745 [Acidobacteria bacterium]|nr:hypothetical protein [Acidobacteriota bacterium]
MQVDPTGLNVGQYEGQISVTSGSNTATTRVRLSVDTAQSSRLVVVPQALNFNIEPNARRPLQPRMLEVRSAGRGENRGPGGGGPGGAPVTQWTASVNIDKPTGGNWLTISPTSGKTPDKITVTANPTGLAAGTYSGKVIVKSGLDTTNVLVFLRILGSGTTNAMVSPKQLRFTATTGATGVVSPATRTIRINTTSTGLNFTATATTAKGGNWLKITPASGAVPGSITASVDAANATSLAPGLYTGAIEVKTPGAAKQLSTILVGLRVKSQDDKPHLELEPGGLAFNATVGGSGPSAKQVELQPEGAASLAWNATTTVASPAGGTWLSVSPTSGTTTTASTSKVNVSVNIAGLVAGTYSGTVVFTPDPASGAPAVHLNVVFVMSAVTVTATRTALVSDDGGAAVAPGNLVALFTSPSDGFIADFAAPPLVSVIVLDSQGAPVEGATVRITSSNSEPDMTLEDIGGGEYQSVFRALSSGPLTLTGTAEFATQSSPGFGVSGDMEASSDQPTIIFQNGAVSAASMAQGPVPLAPGSLASLFGMNLAGEGGAARTVPLSTSLGGVRVTIGGIPAPLLGSFAAQGQINLQLPFELQGQSAADIVINNNGVLSQPETVEIGVAPALFTVSNIGTGAGAFLRGSDFAPISASSPATAGEVILLYATGLGAVLPAVDSGTATSGVANVSGNVTVTIGGQNAPVEFAGLAPGFVGLYQINVRVPAGLSAGDALVVLSVDGTAATGEATVSIR